MSEDLSAMRHEYGRGQLRRRDLHADPIVQFAAWFEQACRVGIDEPNAMSVATVDAEARPSLRTVLLKQFDARGFVFFTNLESRKAHELAGNPNVALLFPWIQAERQVMITGHAVRTSTAESLAYFVRRPVDSRLAAWSSHQSRTISSRAMLEASWEQMKRRFADGDVPLPAFWGGIRVVPRTFEFWQGRPNRLHDRFQYARLNEGGWSIERLAP